MKKKKYLNVISVKKILSSKQMLEIHKEKCSCKKYKIDEFKCQYCDKVLSTKQMLENHKNICNLHP